MKQAKRHLGEHVKRQRGRPAVGFDKARTYTYYFAVCIKGGMSPTQAVHEVAAQFKKAPGHIWACRQLVRDAGIREEEDIDYL